MILGEIEAELQSARVKHPTTFRSSYEGYAILLEEVRELFDEICRREEERDLAKMRHEATQIAAMAWRFVEDLISLGPAGSGSIEISRWITDALQRDELEHPDPIHSAHEGYALLLVGVHELWDLIRRPGDYGGTLMMRGAAIRIAAIAWRFVEDVIDLQG